MDIVPVRFWKYPKGDISLATMLSIEEKEKRYPEILEDISYEGE